MNNCKSVTKKFDTETILKDIDDKKLYQKDIAQIYAAMIWWKLAPAPDHIEFDVAKINKAIIDRWSRSGLERIKKMAWDWSCFD